MPKLSDIRRIIPESFKKEDQEMAEQLAGSYNEFADEIYQVVNGALDFDNLAREKVQVDITFGSNGNPTVPTSIRTGLSSVSMIHIGKVQNATNTAERFTATPYIDWSFQGNGLVKIIYGIGFITGRKYRLTLELIK